MVKIDFNEYKHEYSVNGQKVPSVSEILSPLSADRYRDLNPAILQYAAERGKAVHEACEAIDYGLDPEIDPEIVGYVIAYQDFIRDYFPKWELIEQITGCFYTIGSVVCREEDDLPIYAGTLDRYGKIDGRPVVLDIKTYASLSTDAMIGASCQTVLYADALESNGYDFSDGISRYILHLKKDGKYRLVNLGEFDNKRGFNSRAIAHQLVHINKALTDARKGKKKDE